MAKGHERQYNLDLLKALAIVSMVLCHPVITLVRNQVGYENEFWFFFADNILGAYIVVAHGFMFAMGVGIAFSRNNAPGDLIRRGAKILILAYVLNFFRAGMYYMAYDLIGGGITDVALWRCFSPDILHFAGLALMVTGILKKLNLGENFIVGIGLVLSVIGTVTAFAVDTSNLMLNMVLGLFVFTPNHASTFCFCCWYLFVAVGLLFGKILQETPDKDAFYKKVLVGSGIIAAIYIAATAINGVFFLCVGNAYYDASPLEAAGLLSIDLFLLSVFHFVLKAVDASKLKVPVEMSKNINSIYCIHWCIIGLTEFVCCYLLDMQFAWPFMYAYAVLLVVVSFLLARFYKSLKERYLESRIV